MPSWLDAARDLAAPDRRLTAAFDRALAAGRRAAGAHLVCRRGCTPCCVGVFDITPLDAARLARGLDELARRHSRRAAAVRERAAQQWRVQQRRFPGSVANRTLGDDERARARFFARGAAVPCPVLEPSGACALYAARPLSCRSYGLPVRFGSAALPPCPLNFTRATRAEVAAAAVSPDPEDREGLLLALLAARCPEAGDTTVAAALAE